MDGVWGYLAGPVNWVKVKVGLAPPSAYEQMTYETALRIFGFSKDEPIDETKIDDKYREFSKEFAQRLQHAPSPPIAAKITEFKSKTDQAYQVLTHKAPPLEHVQESSDDLD